MKLILFVFGVQSWCAVIINGQKNNVCKTINDYNTKLFNKNCWYNPDVDLQVPDIITRHNYPVETHRVVTKDGYILNLFRIPGGKYTGNGYPEFKKQPVFLQHGIFSSSAPWILNGNESIGFILADSGYDVWLGNSRGSTYGKGHIKYKLDDTRYWNFSYHEMGIYDLPKSFDYVYKVTGRKDIIYIGQSMGTNLPYVYSSIMPQHAQQRLKLIVNLAPTVILLNVRTPYVVLAPFWPVFKELGEKLKITDFLPNSPVTKKLSQAVCLESGLQVVFCEDLMFSIFGFDFQNLPPATVPLLISHYPAGSSLNTLLHLFQGATTKRFSQFDHGPELNLQYYDSRSPPDYNLSKVPVPSYIMYGVNDWVGSEEGAIKLYKSLPQTIGIYKVKNKKFNHIDSFFAKNIMSDLIDQLMIVVNKFKN